MGPGFFPWYNHEHRHSAIAFLTPADGYYGRAEAALERRHTRLLTAYEAHTERFPHGPPKRRVLAPATYVNLPRHTPEPVVVAVGGQQHGATSGGAPALWPQAEMV